MGSNSFISRVREYGALTQRFHRSYAEAVTAVLDLRVAAINRQYEDNPAEAARLTAEAVDIVEREYARFDGEYTSAY